MRKVRKRVSPATVSERLIIFSSNYCPPSCRQLLPELHWPRGDRQTSLPLSWRRGGRSRGLHQGRSVCRCGRDDRRHLRHKHRFAPTQPVHFLTTFRRWSTNALAFEWTISSVTQKNCLSKLFTSLSPNTPVSHYPQGKTDLSHIDPVVIGRSAFNAANEFASGIADCVQDALCAVLDNILEVVKGIYPHYVTANVNCFSKGNIAFLLCWLVFSFFQEQLTWASWTLLWLAEVSSALLTILLVE